ncbi:MAG: adenylate/guanylate cyclase domain-containing protein, partial [Pseudomonadota bacterium]
MSTKRLATILSLDVAGYSRAAERDDEAAAADVRQLRAAITEIVAPHGGRVFNTAGDGFMLEFPSAAAGVQAAMDLLNAAATRPLPKMRIGVHLGDVIAEANGDLLGHGVNVAARLQALAAPGTAMVSESVRAQVRSATELKFQPEGRVQLDKMSERMEVFSLNPAGVSGLSKIGRRRLLRTAVLGGAGAVVLGGGAAWYAFGPRFSGVKPRLAVLKFQNIGGAEPFFAEGMADELTSELARIDGLDVVGRASSFALDGADATPEGAARKLNATLILSGSVRKNDGAVRVQTQLVQAPSGRQIWAEGFEKPASHVFTLQRDIAVKIARQIDVRTATGPTPAIDPRAYDLYLEARTRNMEATSIDQFEAVRDLFRAALVLQPDFARAWSGLAAVEADHMFGEAFYNGVPATPALLKP